MYLYIFLSLLLFFPHQKVKIAIAIAMTKMIRLDIIHFWNIRFILARVLAEFNSFSSRSES